MRRTFAAGWVILAASTLWVLLATQATARPAAPAQGRSTRAPVTEGPSVGYPGTFFHVGFQAPDPSGAVGGEDRYYMVTASGTTGGRSCASQVSRTAFAPRAHARVRVTLKPGPSGWCLGTFNGRVTEQERPVCPPGKACPLFIILVRTIGKFSFTVRAQPPGGDTTPPVFAGLGSAVACTPGPERPGETSPYTLSWHAAHDAVTPSSQIVYNIFMATASGGEDFSHPTWVSAPGATKFQTPGLPSTESVYFVVRARDRVGNEDTNDIERQGVNPCV